MPKQTRSELAEEEYTTGWHDGWSAGYSRCKLHHQAIENRRWIVKFLLIGAASLWYIWDAASAAWWQKILLGLFCGLLIGWAVLSLDVLLWLICANRLAAIRTHRLRGAGLDPDKPKSWEEIPDEERFVPPSKRDDPD